MGVILSLIRALTLHASDCRAFSVEFSLAALVSFSSRDLRRRSFAPANGIIRLRRGYVGQTGPGYSGARSHCRYGHCDAHVGHDWLVRIPAHMGLSWVRMMLVYFVRCGLPVLSAQIGACM